jgi:hypothetical protein
VNPRENLHGGCSSYREEHQEGRDLEGLRECHEFMQVEPSTAELDLAKAIETEWHADGGHPRRDLSEAEPALLA